MEQKAKVGHSNYGLYCNAYFDTLIFGSSIVMCIFLNAALHIKDMTQTENLDNERPECNISLFSQSITTLELRFM